MEHHWTTLAPFWFSADDIDILIHHKFDNILLSEPYACYSASLYKPGGPKKNGTVNFLELCSDQQLSFFTLLDRASFPHYSNTKIIKFG